MKVTTNPIIVDIDVRNETKAFLRSFDVLIEEDPSSEATRLAETSLVLSVSVVAGVVSVGEAEGSDEELDPGSD